MSFGANKAKIYKSILGELKIKATNMDSSTLNGLDKIRLKKH
jgi:hypothetical protein